MDPELAQWIPLLQIITNATLAFVAVCVATASLVVAYRNNFGWGPFVLMRKQRTEVVYDQGLKRVAGLEFEIWNRRKYPIIIRKARIKFSSELVRRPDVRSTGQWEFRGNIADYRNERTLAPTTHESLSIDFSFDEAMPAKFSVDFMLHVTCFDPRTKKKVTIRASGIYYARERKDAVWG